MYLTFATRDYTIHAFNLKKLYPHDQDAPRLMAFISGLDRGARNALAPTVRLRHATDPAQAIEQALRDLVREGQISSELAASYTPLAPGLSFRSPAPPAPASPALD